VHVSRFDRSDNGTAAGNRRRFAVRAAALAAMFVSLAGCARRSAPDVDVPRRTARKAVAIVRTEAPAQARLIERLVALAEIATAAEANAPWWEGSVGRTEAAWLRVARAAHDAVTGVRDADSRAEKRFASLQPNARSEVARALAEINEAGMGRHEAAAMQRALVSISFGEKLAAAERRQEAADELATAHASAAVVHRKWIALHARFSDPANLRLWHAWAEQTIEESRRTGETVILIDKLRRRVFLYRGGRVIASYPAELGANGLVRKEHSGDRATPEGRYHIVLAKRAPQTKFSKALLINYPNDEDRMRFALGRRRGTISQRAGIGNLIEIHGDGGEGRDWTDGCVALTNEDMDRLFAHVGVGMPVTIVGSYER
jgi:L,D-peptidoglycan transpeptidase YkuD (ErfK/YbiS/YcfS/YnhG family)